MKRVPTRPGNITVGLLMFALTAALAGSPKQTVPCYAQQGPQVVAKVNGEAITVVEVDQAIDTFVPQGTFHGGITDKQRDQYRKPALEMLIERELIYQEALSKGIRPSDKEVDKALGDIRKQYKDKKAFERALRQSGLTLEEYRNIIKRNIAIDTLLKTEVEDKSKYADKDVEAYYTANKTKFLKPEAVRIRHILVKVAPPGGEKEKKDALEKAASLLGRVKAGEDFGALAYDNSDDEYRVKGGDLGWVHRGRLDPAVEEAAFAMKSGESILVETQHGVHILKLEDKKQAGQLAYGEVKDSLREDLESKKREELKKELMARLKDKAKIEIYE